MQVQLAGGKLRGGDDDSAQKLSERARQEFGVAVQPQDVTLPPYYPREAVLLRDWAAYLDAVRFTDKHVGEVLARLEKEGILDNTLIVFMTDHGISHARGKQFLYNEGTHVPFVVRGPGISQRSCARGSDRAHRSRRTVARRGRHSDSEDDARPRCLCQGLQAARGRVCGPGPLR